MSDFRTAVVEADGTLRIDSSDAVVAWWSFTKPLIAACALLLAERRLVALEDRLPGLPYTLRQLLQHRAGVGNYGVLAEYHAAVAKAQTPWSHLEVLRRVPPDELLFAPDTGWAYSNVGYLLVRQCLERAHGAGLGAALRSLVLQPLGLDNSRLAETADEMRETAYPPPHGYHPGWVFHGCVIGPVSEAALALHRLLTGNLLAPASRDTLLGMFPIDPPPAGRSWLTTGYGLGMMMGTMQRPGMARPVEVVGHTAAGPGSVGAVYHCRQNGRPATAAVFTNGPDEGVAEDAALGLLVRL